MAAMRELCADMPLTPDRMALNRLIVDPFLDWLARVALTGRIAMSQMSLVRGAAPLFSLSLTGRGNMGGALYFGDDEMKNRCFQIVSISPGFLHEGLSILMLQARL
jgi:hypothetical protein